MINKNIVIVLITLSLAACSSYKGPEILDGKNREPINQFRYAQPPLVIIEPSQKISNTTIQATDNTKRSVTRQVTPIKTNDILDAEERSLQNKTQI